jgi:predicted RNA-binding protein with TRAM domain
MYREEGGYSRSGSFGSSAPVNVGDELDVKIEAVGEKGDGIAKKDGFVLFVPNTKEGQEVRVRVTKVLRKVGFAEVVGSAGSRSEKAPKAEEKEEVQDTEDFGDDPEPANDEN